MRNMAYDDYPYYTETYCGKKLSREEFPFWAERASDWIDYLTEYKADGNTLYSEQIKKACCAVAEVVFVNETQGGGIVSASNDGYSESYANTGSQQTAEQRVLNTARRYLSGTGLLYRGVKRC